MIIKKYLVLKDSIFNKSIILPLYEGGDFGFHIDGFDFDQRRKLFNPSEVKLTGKSNEVKLSSVTTNCVLVYLDDSLSIRAIVFQDKNKVYYCFRADPQNPKVLKIQTNYIGKDLDVLTKDFETSRSGKKYYKGKGDPKDIQDIDYFKHKYKEIIFKQTNGHSDISRVIFEKGNIFTADFVRMVELKQIKVADLLNKKMLNRDVPGKQNVNRHDCVLINTNTKRIDYFIYTYRPLFINHYYLFKQIDLKEYQYICESTSFDELFDSPELRHLEYKDHSLNDGNILSTVSYKDFVEQYIQFKQDENIDEILQKELSTVGERLQKIVKKGYFLPPDIKNILDKYGFDNDNGMIYFKDFEIIPLAFLELNHINICENRSLNDDAPMKRFHYRDKVEIESTIHNLLINQPSSRLLNLSKLIERVTKKYYEGKEEQLILIKEIEDKYKTIWESDRKNQTKYIRDLMKSFTDWKTRNNSSIKKLLKEADNSIINDVNLSLHGSGRLNERIDEKLSNANKLALAKLAYEKGKTAIHFFGISDNDFKVMQFIQNKNPDATIRLYEDYVFVYSLKPPHTLITCLSYKQSYDNFMKHEIKKK